MEEYMEFLIASTMTIIVIALVGMVVVGGYIVYKIIKDEY